MMGYAQPGDEDLDVGPKIYTPSVVEFRVTENGKLEYSWVFDGNKFESPITAATKGPTDINPVKTFDKDKNILSVDCVFMGNHSTTGGTGYNYGSYYPSLKLFVGDCFADGTKLTVAGPGVDPATKTVTVSGGYITIGINDGGTYTLTPAADGGSGASANDDAKTDDADDNEASQGGQTTPDSPFTDVKSDDWFFDSVMWAYENGVVFGTSQDSFSPKAKATRGMIAAILWRLEGSPTADENDFSDVTEGAYFFDAVAWAQECGIVTGYDGKFNPDSNITREQMITILYRYARYKGYDTDVSGDLSAFDDASSVSDWATDAMAWAIACGIINGTDLTHLSPESGATRAQIVTILQRFVEFYK
jgi:hypothetical protein